MREIFIQTFEYWLLPLFLFLVNHRWKAIASGISLLRSIIHVRRPQDYKEMCTEYEVPVFCTSSSQFSNALARIGDAKFELIVTWIPDDIVFKEHPLRTRCCSLKLGFYSSEQASLLDLPTLNALKELTIGDYLFPSFQLPEDAEEELLKQIESSSPSLVALRIYAQLPRTLHCRSQLLGRVKVFEVAVNKSWNRPREVKIITDSLTSVEEVIWERQFDSTEPIFEVPKSVQTLYMLGAPIIPQKPLGALVKLTIGYDGYEKWRVAPGSVLSFPVLSILELQGCWMELPRIRAPLLHLLSISNPDESNAQIKELIPLVQIQPKILYISSHISDANLIALLYGIWSGVEELHWMCTHTREPLSSSLTRAFAGSPRVPPLCTSLRFLTVDVGSSEEKNPGLLRRSVERLQTIIKSRKTRGVDQLVTVRCGWSGIDDGYDDLPTSGTCRWVDVL
jgi:hypothetical protein